MPSTAPSRFHGDFFPALTPAIRLCLVANAVVFAANFVLAGRLSGDQLQNHWLALSWPGLWDGYGLGLLRLFTYQFTHDYFDPWHFVVNMVCLWLFGHVVEGVLGFRGTLKFYLAAGLAGGIVQLLLMLLMGRAEVPIVGASGAVFGMMVYAACVMPHARTLFYLQLWVVTAILVGVELYLQVLEMREGFRSGVAHGGHLGGALWGLLAWRTGWHRDHASTLPGHGLVRSLRAFRARAGQGRLERDRARLDSLLDKVKQAGLGSLTAGERRFLQRTSERSRR
jgi:membrane associated rhomboid family serine protease